MIRRLVWLASTPFNVVAVIAVAGLLLVRLVQERPVSTPIDPSILEFEQGPRKAEVPLRLYFASPDAQSFAIETRGVPVSGSALADRASAAVNAWIAGPTSQGALPLVAVQNLPEPTIFAKAGTVYIDLPKRWATNQLGTAGEFLMICGLANTVLELDGAKAVQYLLDGKPTETIGGHVETTEPFTLKTCRGS